MSQHGLPSAEELWERHERLVLEVFQLALQMLRKELALPVDEPEVSAVLYLKTREANFHLNSLARGLTYPPIPDTSIPPRSRSEIGTPPTKKRPDFQCPYRDSLATDQVVIHEFTLRQQGGGCFLSEVGVDGVVEELEDAAILLTAGRQHGPDAFRPTLTA